MQIHDAPTAEDLATILAGLWSGERADPFAFDLAVVPGPGFQRWLSQRLAGDPEGICAGVEFCGFTGLERRLGQPEDPWQPNRLAWRILRIVHADATQASALAVVHTHLSASLAGYPTAVRIARQFFGYAAHRPSLLRAWADGEDVGPDGEALGLDRWQAELWRRLAAEIGTDPLRQRAELLARLHAGPVPDLPPRVAVIAPPRLDPSRLELLEAVGHYHRVDLLLLRPSPSRRLPSVGIPRSQVRALRPSGHPLNLTLGVIGDELAGLVPAATGKPAGGTSEGSLLSWLQADLAADEPPTPRLLSTEDDSIQVHLSHGRDRQVEVLREVLTRILAENPSLEPRDIVVLTPAVDEFAPRLLAAFSGDHPGASFRLRIADRSLTQVNPLVALLLQLLDLPDSRLEASTVLDLCAQPAIAHRFGFTEDAHDRLVTLVRATGIRWGLSARHRRRFGLAGFEQNTWFAGLQRMLLGIALSESDLVSAGTVLPLDDVESTDVDLIGALSEFIGRLGRLLDVLDRPASLAEWVDRCRDALGGLIQVGADDQWQLADLWAGLDRIAGHGDVPVELGRHDFRSALVAEFEGTPARGAFGNGSLVVAGLSSLRHVPHRVVVALGWDARSYPRSGRRGGDDLLGRTPLTGEPSAALEDRQVLLDAVHAAREKFVLVLQGRDESTNEPVPLAAPIADLLEALDLTAATADGRPAGKAVRIDHPLQPFDPGYFDPRRPELASADLQALRAAFALIEPHDRREQSRYHLDPLPTPRFDNGIPLEDLTSFFAHPARHLLKVRAGLSLAERSEPGDDIPIELDHLGRWQIGNRILQGLRAGQDPAAIERAEWLRGEVPPYELGRAVMAGVITDARTTAAAIPAAPAESRLHDLAISVPIGGDTVVDVVGRVSTQGRELVQVEYSRLQPKHRLISWLRLLALSAAETGPWHAVIIAKGRRATLAAPPADTARQLLSRYVELYALGLTRQLPAPPRLCAAWAESRASDRDPLDPRRRSALDRFWSYDSDASWQAFFDYPGILHLGLDGLVVPGADPIESTLLGALATSIWSPLLAAEVS